MQRRQRGSEPADTDLEYYTRPENYRGSSLGSLTRFLAAKSQGEAATNKNKNEEQEKNGEESYLLRRYEDIRTWMTSHTSTLFLSDEDMANCDSWSRGSSGGILSASRGRYCVESAGSASYRRDYIEESIMSERSHRLTCTDNESVLSNEDCSDKRLETTQFDNKENLDLDPEIGSMRSKWTDQSTSEHINGEDGLNDVYLTKDGCHNQSDTSKYTRSINDWSLKSSVWTSRSNTANTGGWSSRNISPTSRNSSVKSRTTSKKYTNRGKLLSRFKRLSKAVINVLKLAKAIIKQTDSPSALLETFTGMSREPEKEGHSENMKNYGLHFDPSYFRAKKEISISSEVKNILRLPPRYRSIEQIQTAMYGLQSLPSFAEYPLHMQEKLAKVAWHEIVTPMRTIIRQGHFAENFYFILSGQAVVTIAKPGETSPQTAAIMRKGTSFGELALLHHSRRTATVTSHDTVQLLSVGREDFFDIFMSGRGREQIPEHIKFISQMDFMKDWPLDKLLERPDQCLLHFFKRNMVIVKDSKCSDWLYVVKSGSCQVLKQLKIVSTRHGQPRNNSLNKCNKVAKPGQPRNDSILYKYNKVVRRVVVGKQTDRGPGQQPSRAVSYNLNSDRGPGQQPSRAVSYNLNSDRGPGQQPSRVVSYNLNSNRGPGQQPSRAVSYKIPKLFIGQRKVTVNTVSDQEVPSDNEINRQFSKEGKKQPVEETRHKLPVFVQIELLKPNGVFGLDLVNFNSNLDPNSPSVSLISLGAECIMLSKSFFMKHASDHLRKRFSETIRPYPDDKTMQESLETKENWQLYKKSLIFKIMAHKYKS